MEPCSPILRIPYNLFHNVLVGTLDQKETDKEQSAATQLVLLSSSLNSN